jgi:hypothetical protein
MTAIKGTRYRIFTGLSQGTVKVLRDPEAETQQGEGAKTSPISSELIAKGEGAGMSTPPGPRLLNGGGQQRPPHQLLQIQGPLWTEPDLPRKEK